MARAYGHITIAVVGKIRTRHWLAAQDDYLKRLKHYATVDLIEVKDIVGRGVPDAQAMAREGQQLLDVAARANRTILLDPTGRELDSPQLARDLQSWLETYGGAAFLIGGPLGFAPEVTAAAHESLALSRLTFTHELARVVWLEQLYRAFTILHGEPYHK
jgi:23S rRNA (pseudouridine1915-N3)-methyltransferase